jgi:hypothetical protein
MKVNLTETIKGLDGEDIMRPGLGGEPVPMTMAFAIRSALVQPGQQAPGAAEQLQRYDLQLKLHAVGEVNLTAEDVVLIKSVLPAVYGPLVVGPIFKLLEPFGG